MIGNDRLDGLAGGVIVSCQARADNPLHGPAYMAAMARAAVLGGAVGLRANGAGDVAAIRAVTDLPIIGIHKVLDGRVVYITPEIGYAREVAAAGADIIAIDATRRERPVGVAELVGQIHDELGLAVMADCDDVASGLAAAEAGAELISTTLSGYAGGPAVDGPDLELVAELAARLDRPVVAEGRIATPAQMAAAFDAGAWAVVIGTAITNPWRITERFTRAAPAAR